MSEPEENPWPALTIQGTFLGANLGFILAGQSNLLVLISFGIIVVLFSIQAMTGNERFLYLFPVRSIAGDSELRDSTGYDTHILRLSILISVFLFFWGAGGGFLGAALVFVIGFGFPIIWKRSLKERNQRYIAKRIGEKRCAAREAEAKQPPSSGFHRGSTFGAQPVRPADTSAAIMVGTISPNDGHSNKDHDEQ